MSSSHKWTCAECGESYEASGVMAKYDVSIWRLDHKQEHRIEKMGSEDQSAYWESRNRSAVRVLQSRLGLSGVEKGEATDG